MKLLRIIEIEKIRRKYNINITISFLHQPNILNVTAGGCELKICSERNDPEGKGIDYFNEMTSSYEKADKVDSVSSKDSISNVRINELK